MMSRGVEYSEDSSAASRLKDMLFSVGMPSNLRITSSSKVVPADTPSNARTMVCRLLRSLADKEKFSSLSFKTLETSMMGWKTLSPLSPKNVKGPRKLSVNCAPASGIAS